LDFKIEENNKKKEENKKETERYRRIYEELLLELNKIKGYIDSLGKDELYMEVRDFVPEYSPISIEVLKRERKELKDVLNKKQKDRENISYNIMKISDAKEEHRKDLKNLILRAKYQSEKDMEFPIYGEAEIEDLIKSIKVLSPLLDKKEKELNRFKEKYQNIKSKYEVKEEDYFKVYDKIVEFTDSLGNVKKEIDDEKIELGKRIDYLNSMEEKWDKELKSIEEVLNNLRLKNEKYEYLSDNIISLGLSDDMIQGLPYDRMKYVNLVLNSLENIKKETEENIIKVDKEKRDFEMFCSEHISEPRLKNMALWGIKYKDKYDDIIEWQKNIDKRIDKTVNILEMDMMEHDKEINQFVKYLNSYLKSLAQEIGSISKKTRIKVDDKSKNIYIIDVPEWKEEFGKEEIRNYINIMIKDIESNEFKDEEGKEDKSSVRKYIEDKFQAKQLMKALMAGDGIKVKCRKVTNDGKVNSIPVSWEKTNSWSGGEKWSKNMTLFLGILNYLAEKKQSINFEQKRNRTVILDNPFGEASSNHVLDPVFFIAEQLGFQIIALTAHSEGKYIRDYFPIVYSCRLRPSLDKDTQIFTKEREIKYAFFKDNDPQVLSRLGEKEQLTMF
jgi:DNA repair exonuclease SbcCD ATPase subunit